MKTKGERAAMVPLAVLLRRETSSEKMERPDVLYGQVSQSKRGENLTLIETALRRDPGDSTLRTPSSRYEIVFSSLAYVSGAEAFHWRMV